MKNSMTTTRRRKATWLGDVRCVGNDVQLHGFDHFGQVHAFVDARAHKRVRRHVYGRPCICMHQPMPEPGSGSGPRFEPGVRPMSRTVSARASLAPRSEPGPSQTSGHGQGQGQGPTIVIALPMRTRRGTVRRSRLQSQPSKSYFPTSRSLQHSSPS